tara:strand:+ start:216 stop:437 length:222 start_codon:yes stop_codon:yes gene_type:complete
MKEVSELYEMTIGAQCDCGDRSTPPHVLGSAIEIEPHNNPKAQVFAWHCPECDRSFAIHFVNVEAIVQYTRDL